MVFAIDSKKVILVDSPHQGVHAILTMDQAIVSFLGEAEIQGINEAFCTFRNLADGFAFAVIQHVVTLASLGNFSGRSLQ
jgi:hypothetical protein